MRWQFGILRSSSALLLSALAIVPAEAVKLIAQPLNPKPNPFLFSVPLNPSPTSLSLSSCDKKQMEEFLYTDIESSCAKLKHQEKQLKLKRRQLMGLPLSDYEQKQLSRVKFQENKTVPESFLRENDVYYQTIKAFVEKGIGACNFERVYHVDQDNIQMFDLPNDLRNLLSMLDDMTNNGLQLLAEILTGGSIKFGNTRWKMKKIIKECLPEVLGNLKGNYKINMAEQLCQLLRNSHNFRRNCSPLLTPAPQFYHAAATCVTWTRHFGVKYPCRHDTTRVQVWDLCWICLFSLGHGSLQTTKEMKEERGREKLVAFRNGEDIGHRLLSLWPLL